MIITQSVGVMQVIGTPPPPEGTPPDLDDPPFNFRSGTFTITGANGRDGLEGDYSGFVMGEGTYDLEWDFTGGTGRFEDARSTEGTQGHTDGLVDLETGYAEFEFSGEITVPKGK